MKITITIPDTNTAKLFDSFAKQGNYQAKISKPGAIPDPDGNVDTIDNPESIEDFFRRSVCEHIQGIYVTQQTKEKMDIQKKDIVKNLEKDVSTIIVN